MSFSHKAVPPAILLGSLNVAARRGSSKVTHSDWSDQVWGPVLFFCVQFRQFSFSSSCSCVWNFSLFCFLAALMMVCKALVALSCSQYVAQGNDCALKHAGY